ncbi:MAG: DUF6114 domain-containing protein [Desulfurococcaceae archaeon]
MSAVDGMLTAAFVLSLIAGILVIIASAVVTAGALAAREVPFTFNTYLELVVALFMLNLVLGVLIILGATLIRSGEEDKVRKGSAIVLALSVVSLFTAGGGFIVGFLLGIAGGALGLAWRPPQARTQPPPASTAT